MKKNSMGLNRHEYAAYLRELASQTLSDAHERSSRLPEQAAGLYDQSAECMRAARRAELTQEI